MASIQGVYIALFGRPADPIGLSFFNQATNNGANLTAIGDLASTPEYQTRFTGQTNVQIVNSIYQSLFNRPADLAGLTFFANALATGTFNINNIAIAIFDGAQGSDVTIRDLKVAAASSFTAAIDTSAEVLGYQGTAAAESGRQFITSVTTTAPSEAQVTAAVAAAVQAGAGGGAVATFTLTPGLDFADAAGSFRNGTATTSGTPTDFKFTNGAETVNATTASLVVVGGGDALIDGSTTDQDVLNVVLNGNTSLNTVTNIEKIAITANAAGGAIDFTNVTGAQTVVITGAPTSALTLGTVTNTGITTVDASGMTSAVNGVSVDFSASTTVVARSLTGGLAGDTLTGGAGADTISGGGGVDILSGGAGADTLSGGAGGDTLNGGTGNDTLNGDAGDDTLNGDLGNDVINGGAGVDTIASGGGTDTISGNAGNDLITLTGGAGNSETLKFEAAASDNGSDQISGFAGGTIASGGDVMNFSAFLGATATFAGTVAGATVAPAGIGYTAAAGENVIVIETDAALDTDGTAGLSLAELTASTLKIGNSAKAVILYDAGADTGDAAAGADTVAYYVTTDINGAYASLSVVGTYDLLNASTLVSANFA